MATADLLTKAKALVMAKAKTLMMAKAQALIMVAKALLMAKAESADLRGHWRYWSVSTAVGESKSTS